MEREVLMTASLGAPTDTRGPPRPDPPPRPSRASRRPRRAPASYDVRVAVGRDGRALVGPPAAGRAAAGAVAAPPLPWRRGARGRRPAAARPGGAAGATGRRPGARG